MCNKILLVFIQKMKFKNKFYMNKKISELPIENCRLKTYETLFFKNFGGIRIMGNYSYIIIFITIKLEKGMESFQKYQIQKHMSVFNRENIDK